MKIIILGAGQVGSTLAENLAHEQNDITVVDTNAPTLKMLQERLDIQTIHAHGAWPTVLADAGAQDADMLLAVTSQDETNMVACQIAHTLFKLPLKIARIRNKPYLLYAESLFKNSALPIDFVISPEQEVTEYITQLIDHPGTLQVLNFAKGLVKIVALSPRGDAPLVGKTITEIKQFFCDCELAIINIFRNNRAIKLTPNTAIEMNDEIVFITASHYLEKIISSLHANKLTNKRIMIAGGGHIGARLAQALEAKHEVKVIEPNGERAEYISNMLEDTIVLTGDAADKELLRSENIESMDMFCALTNSDSINIVTAMLAKRMGAQQTIALVTHEAFIDLIEEGTIDIPILPQKITTNRVLRFLRKGDVVNVNSIHRGAAEVIEVVAHGDEKTSKVVERKIGDIRMPPHASIIALIRNDQVYINCSVMTIKPNDHVIVLIGRLKYIKAVEELFQVKVKYY